MHADMFENICKPVFVNNGELVFRSRHADRPRTVDLLSIVYGWPAQPVAREQLLPAETIEMRKCHSVLRVSEPR